MCPHAFALALAAVPALGAEPLSGAYVEARTCQVYTGPCFANGEVGQTGKDAVMTWRIDRGEFAGADLAGQSVAVLVKASRGAELDLLVERLVLAGGAGEREA